MFIGSFLTKILALIAAVSQRKDYKPLITTSITLVASSSPVIIEQVIWGSF